VPDAYKAGWVDQVGGMSLVRFRLFLDDNGIDIDVFLADSPFHRSILDRRRREDVDGATLYLVSPEDLVLLKLVAGRPRDIAGIHEVLFVQGDLDAEYMRIWAERLGIADRLTDALAGPPSI